MICTYFIFSIFTYAQTRPNIVIIFSDDLGIGSSGTYGAPTSFIQTPAVNGIAEEGRKYINAYTPASLCSPSRYALLTGRYFWRDVRDWGIIQSNDPNVIPQDKNLAIRLKNEGYNTACIGKWHLGYNDSGRVGGAEVIGFDHNYDYRTGINTSNETRTAEFLDEETSEWIDAQSNSNPFFLYFAPIAVHTPIIPGVEYQGTSGAGAYGDYINELDGSVENILDALERNGFTDNTLVIFTSDNGAAAGSARSNGSGDLKVNGDYRGTKLTIFDAGFRVPLIVKWPGNVPAGTISNKDVNVVDIYASIMEMLNIEMGSPEEEAGDSFSFFSTWFDDSNQTDRENMILTSYEGIAAIYTSGWKYIDGMPREPEPYDFFNSNRQQQEGIEQLYNIIIDPFETNNLIDTETTRASELKLLLNDIRVQGYSRPNSEIDGNNSPAVRNPIEDQLLTNGFGSKTIDISNVFFDSNGDELSFQWAVEDETIITVTGSDDELTIHEEGASGETMVTLTANDGNGKIVSDMFLVKINTSPFVQNPIEDQVFMEGFGSATIDISDVFSDGDSDPITYSLTIVDENVVTVTESDSKLTFLEANITGETLIALSANDGNGGIVLDEFLVSVEALPVLSLASISEKIKLFPNPVINDDLNIELTSLYIGKVTFTVVDLTGKAIIAREILKSGIDLSFQLETTNFVNGAYVLYIYAGTKISKKIFIER